MRPNQTPANLAAPATPAAAVTDGTTRSPRGRRGLRPIEQLDAEWAVTGRSEASRTALRRLAAAEADVAALAVGDLADLVSALRVDGGTAARDDAAGVVRAMLRSQAVHPLVGRATLQALVPGLLTVARRLEWGRDGGWLDAGAFFTDLVATTWEVLAAWAGEDRRYAVLDVLSAVRCRLRRQLLGERHHAERLLPLERAAEPLARWAPWDTDADLLARAIEDLRGNGLDPADAAVVYGTRVLGLSLSELSRLTGHTRRRLETRRRRATQLLCG